MNSTWADGYNDGVANVGDRVSHLCTVKNEGTTSLVSFCVTGASFSEGCQECPEARTLVPGANFTCELGTEVKYFCVAVISICLKISNDVVSTIFLGMLPRNKTWSISTQY